MKKMKNKNIINYKIFNKINSKRRAFSLFELSIVILIVSIMITGMMSISTSSIRNEKKKVTQAKLKEVYNALGAYTVRNNALPCPARITEIPGNTNYGASVYNNGDCAGVGSGAHLSTNVAADHLVYGMIPFKDLGLSSDAAIDGFGNKFTYVIDRRFAKATPVPDSGSNDSFGNVTDINLITARDKKANIDISNIIFVILSHGENMYGAFAENSTIEISNPNPSSDEANNYFSAIDYNGDVNLDNIFIHKSTDDEFDDYLIFKNRDNFVSDFSAYDAIPCAQTSETLYGATMIWPTARYGQIVEATTNCPAGYTSSVAKPTKKCGLFGIYQSGVVNPCLAP